MTTEWDNTPWAGEEPIKALVIPAARPLIKAVTGAGVAAYANDYPLSTLREEPQARAKAFLRAYKCGWFYKAESKISGDLAKQPWVVHDGDIDSADSEETKVPQPDLDIPFEALNPIDQFMRLMERPNPKQTGRQLRQKTVIRRDMAGWAFWYLETTGPVAPITAIYGISPSRLWPSYDKRTNELLGWVLDYDKHGGTMTFEPHEIVTFANATVDEDDTYGVGVVEAVYAELPLTDLMTRHTADLLTTGGRVAGMMWPRERALDEDEFTDAQRAWRNVVSDPNAARRLLLFPEPMEYASGASTPAEIGIPELAELNRDNILTAFPIAPEVLGVSMPAGQNASGETRRELYDWYWRGTIEPRSSSYDEVIAVHILSRYEEMMGATYRFETELPDLDDASTLLEKAGAFKSLVGIGFDPEASIRAVGLDHIKWKGLPDMLDPSKQAQLQAAQAQQPGPTATVNEGTSGDRSSVTTMVAKAIKARQDVAARSDPQLARFLELQKERVIDGIRATLPRTKSHRGDWAIKADPDWWDARKEDALLREVLANLYVQSARGSLQVVADQVDGIIPNRAVGRIVDDLLAYGGDRIKGINDTTLLAIQEALAEGTKRGYSLDQLIDGVEAEGFKGIKDLAVFDDARAETIARTETMLSYNRAALDAYGEFGVSEVIAYDGDDFDAECAARDGQTFTVEEALAIEDHPNGTLDWAPVTDKAYKDPSVKVDVGAPVINVHMPDQVVNIPPTEVTVKTPDLPTPVVHVAPAEVNVAPAVVNLAPAEVHVPAPIVNVTTPDVTVNPPVVNVKAQPSDVQVTVSPEMRITALPERVTERRVERDDAGKIVRTVDVETDG